MEFLVRRNRAAWKGDSLSAAEQTDARTRVFPARGPKPANRLRALLRRMSGSL